MTVSKIVSNADGLSSVQAKIDESNNLLQNEIQKLQSEFELKKEDLYKERAIAAKNVPRFWATCIENHSILSDLANSDDLQASINSTIERWLIITHYSFLILWKILLLKGIPKTPIWQPLNGQLVQTIDLGSKTQELVDYTIDWKKGMCLINEGEEDESSFFTIFTSKGDPILLELLVNDFYPNATNYYYGSRNDTYQDVLLEEEINTEFINLDEYSSSNEEIGNSQNQNKGNGNNHDQYGEEEISGDENFDALTSDEDIEEQNSHEIQLEEPENKRQKI
ncbi:hypothetical protein BB559_003181 [Furculomyces boomerangus]|uniref:Uncharacterized protein n=1 Tax=Furculomyces boomerangus TaxID=61424 RepID=A0A2T9YN07_9FUNG|nr:hypothetical protein BB559_003181 [Furculomyces boomerangus]